MAAGPHNIVQEAVDAAISERGEIGLQVAAYVDGKQVVDVWGSLADATTGKMVDADTLFPVFSVTKAVTAIALHIQTERGLVDRSVGRIPTRGWRSPLPTTGCSEPPRLRRIPLYRLARR